jgi:hypothetical protein
VTLLTVNAFGAVREFSCCSWLFVDDVTQKTIDESTKNITNSVGHSAYPGSATTLIANHHHNSSVSPELLFASEQTWKGVDVLRGAGADNTKFKEFCAVSTHPLLPRAIAMVLLGVGAAALPSKQLAVLP